MLMLPLAPIVDDFVTIVEYRRTDLNLEVFQTSANLSAPTVGVFLFPAALFESSTRGNLLRVWPALGGSELN